jgi:hypothetical protein
MQRTSDHERNIARECGQLTSKRTLQEATYDGGANDRKRLDCNCGGGFVELLVHDANQELGDVCQSKSERRGGKNTREILYGERVKKQRGTSLIGKSSGRN